MLENRHSQIRVSSPKPAPKTRKRPNQTFPNPGPPLPPGTLNHNTESDRADYPLKGRGQRFHRKASYYRASPETIAVLHIGCRQDGPRYRSLRPPPPRPFAVSPRVQEDRRTQSQAGGGSRPRLDRPPPKRSKTRHARRSAQGNGGSAEAGRPGNTRA